MITELEQKFYDIFGIEPLEYICTNVPYEDLWYECTDGDYNKCKICKHVSIQYHEITAEKLLEMICVLNNYGKYDCWGVTIARLKKAILENCIVVVISKSLNNVILEQFKQRIQQLFKE